MNKTTRILAAVGAAISYEQMESATGLTRSALAPFVFHLVGRGFVTKTRACRNKPAVFSITAKGMEHLQAAHRRAHLRRPGAIVEAAKGAIPPLEAAWPSVVAGERQGFEPFDYAERN